MTTRQVCIRKECPLTERRLRFDEVNVGDTAPVREHTLTRTDLVVYAGASGDFNPMHHDEVQAQAAGMPSVFGHGMFSAGLLATALTDYVGIGNLRRYQVRFAKQTWPGDQLTTSITVTDKRKDDGQQLIDLECALLNGNGDAVVTGEATATVPADT
jgi:acyl dehydratase